MLNKKAEQYKTMNIANKQDLLNKKSRSMQNNGYCLKTRSFK